MNRYPRMTVILALVAGLALANASINESFAYTATASAEKTMYGHFTIIVKDEFGNIKDYQEFDNVITDQGDACITNLAFAGSGATCTGGIADRIGVSDCDAPATGEGPGSACAVSANGTTLFDDNTTVGTTDECGDGNKAATSTYTAVSGANKVTLAATFAFAEVDASGEVRQAGITNSVGASCAAADQLWAIKSFTSLVTLVSGDSLTVNYEITFSG